MARGLVLWLVGIVVLAVAFPSPAGLTVAVALVLLVSGVGLWTWWLRRVVVVQIELADRLVFGEVTDMVVVVTNPSRLPAPRVRVEVTLVAGRLLPRDTVLELALPARSTVRSTVEVTAFARGTWSPPPVRIDVSDPWGMWVRPATAPGPTSVTVLPALSPIRRLSLPAVSPLAEVPDRRSLTTDPTAIVGVRPYEPGDPLRSIHWPATAATGTLVRRETERAWARDLVVVLDLNRGGWDRYDQHPSEVAISVAASLLVHGILTLRQPTGLVASMPDDSSSSTGRGASQGQLPAARFDLGVSRSHLGAMLVHLAAADRHTGAPLAELLVREAAIRAPGTTVAVVASEPTEPVAQGLTALRAAGLQPVYVQVGSPEQLRATSMLPIGGASRFTVRTDRPIGGLEL